MNRVKEFVFCVFMFTCFWFLLAMAAIKQEERRINYETKTGTYVDGFYDHGGHSNRLMDRIHQRFPE